MRIASLVLAAALTTTFLSVAAPGAEAFGWCSKYLDNEPRYDCAGYVVCVGYGWDSRGFWCQHGVRDVCDVIYCGPGPVLP